MPFSHEKIAETAEKALTRKCPHVHKDLQADPDVIAAGGALCSTCAQLRCLGHMLKQLLAALAQQAQPEADDAPPEWAQTMTALADYFNRQPDTTMQYCGARLRGEIAAALRSQATRI